MSTPASGSPEMILARSRITALLALIPMVVIAIATHEPVWRSVPMTLAACAVLVVHLRVSVVPERLATNMVVIGPGMMTLLTGGIESPFCAVLTVTMAGSALASGPTPGLPRRVLFGCVVLLASIVLADVPGFVPAMLDRSSPTGSVVAPWLWAYVLLLFLVTFAMTMAQSRAHLDAAHARAVGLQAELAEGLRHRNRELTAISGSLAHELKNPLASIQGLATHMARKAEGAMAEQLDVMVTEIHRMGGILEGLLDVARPLGSLTLNDVSLRGIVDEVIQLHGPFATERGTALSAAGQARASVDVRKITQVVVNLLLNAIEADATTVRLKVSADATGCVIAIIDDGHGFEGESARFFTSGTTTKDTGSGLGLAISAALAEQHGGSLSLHARTQGGCEARLTLPKEIA